MTTVIRRSTTVTVTGGRRQVITLDRATVAAIIANRPSTTVADRRSTTTVQDRRPTVVTGGAMGVQGPQGEPGDGTFELEAGVGGISALRVVVAEDGVARYPNLADPEDAGRVVGVAFTAANAGDDFTVQPDGVLNDAVWAWAPGPVWCGADGVLTQVQPASGWLMEVGRAMSATSLVLDIQKPIIRA